MVVITVATVFDVAQYIMRKQNGITAMKLQKLVYYAQAWSLAWLDRPLFNEPIEAWRHGPVVRELFNMHRGHYTVTELPEGDPDRLTEEEKNVIDAVLERYGSVSPELLSMMTHQEKPWLEAREGLPDDAASNEVIDPQSMRDYYKRLSRKVAQDEEERGGLFYLMCLLADYRKVDDPEAERETRMWDEIEPVGREVW